MDLSKINQNNIAEKIKQEERELAEDRKMTSALEIMELYSGEDRVVSSEDYLLHLQELRERRGNKTFMTGIPKLDEIIGGFKEGQLIVLSAPTGQGKTHFLQSLTNNFAKDGTPCLWFNFEVAGEEFFERFNGEVPTFYLPKKIKGSSLDWLKKRILEGIAKFNTKIIFIDHLHFLLEMEDLAKAKNLSLLIGMLMRELKKIAIKTDTIIFLVSHMKKSLLEKTPTIEDLRDSSFVAQESDLVLMLWRHKIKNSESPTGWEFTNESRLIVEKNRRTGKLGYVKLLLANGRFQEITNYYG